MKKFNFDSSQLNIGQNNKLPQKKYNSSKYLNIEKCVSDH